MLPDVVVIGGGIVGCACAYYLACEGVKVCLVEKGTLASGTSRAGQSHIILWEEPDINLKLEKASRLLYEALAEELPFDIEYRRTGSLALVENAADWEPFARTVRSLQARGLECQLLTSTDLVRMEPNLAPDLAGGAYFPEDAQVNPILTTLALAQAAKNMGAELRPFTEVTGIELSAQRKVSAIHTQVGRIPTAAVVNAAGVWSASIGKMVGLEIPVIPRRGHIIVTEPVPDNLINCKIILAAGYMQTLGATSGVAMSANIQQMCSGNLLLGSSRDFGGFDRTVNPEVIRAQLARNLRFLPALADIHVIRTYAGLRPYSPDLVPIIGAGDSVGGFYIATGHEGAGITMAPITGKLIGEIITGKAPTVPLQPLSLRRFSQRQEEDEFD